MPNLNFRVNIKEIPLTRGKMIPPLSSVYDPLGLAAPFIMKGKQLTQKLCHQNLNWDERGPEDLAYE